MRCAQHFSLSLSLNSVDDFVHTLLVVVDYQNGHDRTGCPYVAAGHHVLHRI